MLKYLFHLLLPHSLRELVRFHLDRYAIKSYSQEGEDMILRRLFEDQKIGFYVDIGAHHPVKFSNTYYFYKRGWSGINIDAMPNSMEAFNKFRSRDINLEQAISEKPGSLPYYIFNEPALNGFDQSLSNERNTSSSSFHITEIKYLQTKRLETILDEYLPLNQNIDFMSIDVEGFDLQVLKSNNWDSYRPEVILIEVLHSTLEQALLSDITNYLRTYDYVVFAKAVNTVIYKLNRPLLCSHL